MKNISPLLIFKSSNSQIFLEENEQNHQKEVVKILNTTRPTPELLSKFLNEYEITKNLDIKGVRRALRITKIKEQEALVLEYVEGRTLENYLAEKKPGLIELLEIGKSLAHTLGEIHQHGIIHKDLNLRNIMVGDNHTLKIIDFGNSTKLNIKTFELSNPKELEGTLAYISPEQTGRMNRVVDFRSDLYSLGVVLYCMFAARRPFESEDELELVHDHIAKIPVPVSEINNNIPVIISNIIAKLLAKNAEDRYQSAFGLEHDLDTCLKKMDAQGNIQDFALQQKDASGQLLFSDKLFGRSSEIRDLMSAFDRAVSGNTELVMVAGYSGIGKSALVNELHKPITLKRGLFISGKFDQLQRAIPHYAFINAIGQLVDYLLTLDEPVLLEVKESIQEAVGANGGVLTSVIPSLELIIGKQETPPVLSPREAQNRFNWTFEQFIYAIANPERPLVLFIDDLQWSDAASLDLLQVLLTTLDGKHLLIIGAYRNNEVSVEHPLTKALEGFRTSGLRITEMELNNLNETALNELISDALKCGPWYSEELTKIIFQKTKGNCFYAIEALKALKYEGLLTYDHNQRTWLWDKEKIAQQSVSQNVGDLLASRSSQYSPETQKALKIAACIGNTFDLRTLSRIHEKDYAQTLSDLWKTMEDGWVIPIDNTYKHVGIGDDNIDINPKFRFSHDRVQEIANELLPEFESARLHLAIGRTLWNDESIPMEEKLFEITNQLLMAGDLIDDPEEKHQLCLLNIEAANRAESNAAFIQAQFYAETALSLLPQNSWENDYELSFKVYKLAATTNFIIGNFERSKELIDAASEKVKTRIEKVECLDLLINQYMFSYQFADALETGRKALGILGFDFPDKDLQPIIGKVNEEIQTALQGKQLPELTELPAMQDAEKIMVMRLLSNIGPPCYIMGKLEEFTHSVFLSVKLSLEYGNSLYSPYAYVQYGLILGFFGQHMVGYMFGDMACKLAEKGGKDSIDQKARTYFIMAEYVQPWVKPFTDSEVPSNITIQTCIECGNNLFRGYAEQHRIFGRFYQGINLNILDKTIRNTLKIQEKNKHMQAVNSIGAVKLFVDYYKGDHNDMQAAMDGYYDHSANVNDIFSMLQFHIYRSQALCIEGNFEEANKEFNLSKEKFSVGKGLFCIEAAQQFYGALSLIKMAQKETEETKKEAYLKEFEEILKVFEGWIHSCPENFGNKYHLLLAEKSVLLGESEKAIDHYKDAIEESAKNNFLSEEAICNEMAALYYQSRNHQFLFQSYLKEAYFLYSRWGAKRKINDLLSQYPHLGTESHESLLHPARRSVMATTMGSETGSVRLDLQSVIKASEAISSEIHFNKMVNNLISVAVENAGAQRGLFIRSSEGSQKIYGAYGYTDIADFPVDIRGGNIVPSSVINLVSQKRETIVLDHAKMDPRFVTDPYFSNRNSQSVMCMPILNLGDLVGLIYLENDIAKGAFNEGRIEMLKMLSGQIAVSLENSILYQNLEQKVEDRTKELAMEKAKSDELLLNILPAKVAAELKAEGKSTARKFENVSVLFSDIVGFTKISSTMDPEKIVALLDEYFTKMDEIISRYGLEKIKTIGDAYMAVGGVPTEDKDNATKMIHASFDIMEYIDLYKQKQVAKNEPFFELRIGIHTGPVVAGVVGKTKFAFDIWGDTVNIASRLETAGTIGEINISETTRQLAGNHFEYVPRGSIAIKNRGEMEMFFVKRK